MGGLKDFLDYCCSHEAIYPARARRTGHHQLNIDNGKKQDGRQAGSGAQRGLDHMHDQAPKAGHRQPASQGHNRRGPGSPGREVERIAEV